MTLSCAAARGILMRHCPDDILLRKGRVTLSTSYLAGATTKTRHWLGCRRRWMYLWNQNMVPYPLISLVCPKRMQPLHRRRRRCDGDCAYSLIVVPESQWIEKYLREMEISTKFMKHDGMSQFGRLCDMRCDRRVCKMLVANNIC